VTRDEPTIHLLHGIHAEERGGNPRLLAPYLQAAGLKVRVRSYGKLKWWQARFANDKLAACFADSIAPGDIIVGHSNGVALAALICDMGAPVGGVVAIQGALDADRPWAPQVPWVDVIANSDDGWVTVSALLLGHMWGSLGRDGYVGPADARIENLYTDERRLDRADTAGLPQVLGHTDFFTEAALAAWGHWQGERIRARIEARHADSLRS